MNSYSNLVNVSKTIACHIWGGIKDDKQITAIIKSPNQITFLPPRDNQPKIAQISVFLYDITELTIMRNQTQDPQKPLTLLNLRLHYLITPLTQNAEDNQLILGKIMQLFAQTPVLHESDLQGSLKSNAELKITLDALEVEALYKIWTMLSLPYKLSIGYTVQPVQIDSPPSDKVVESGPAPFIIKKDILQPRKKLSAYR